MTTPSIDAHVRLDVHPHHSSAVTAVLTGSQAHIAHVALEAGNWSVVGKNTLVLARIDHEEPYWAEWAAEQLAADGITVEITPKLREAMDEEWTWPNYPMHWCTRSEIRQVSNEAQKIHDDIRHGHLLIHAHAHDGHTTVAVGTYLHQSSKSVYLHGEDHLRQVADTFQSPAAALIAFEKAHGAAMRPGPAPLTDTEQDTAQARTSLGPPTAGAEPPRPEPETVPVYAADAGDHDALLDTFLEDHRDWQKWRTWSDDTTHAIHEDQTLRIEHVHETDPHETAWTVAAYESPVSDRMWVLTATGATPAPVLRGLLHHLADADSSDTPLGSPVGEKTVTASTRPLSEAGWSHTVDGRGIRWTSPTGDAGVQFDAFAAQRPTQNLATWTVWGGPNPDRPAWTLTASPYTPSSLLADLSENLAYGTGTRQKPATSRQRQTRPVTTSPAVPVTTGACHLPSRTR
ncbi:DUF317 domain-containing protein [Streptomyces sp. QL37]|uniref:DUF317 domain-containing protein n=1 Tax=Streptomyces sp. QL37 TaxID=2093747 RepID=UPI000CF2D130|nr:DUF317 domain-containing protein [Streptomyces sp. QL37]PPQ56388.1 hypothetical protein C5F59_06700 [Streptomyces sp. QL37]